MNNETRKDSIMRVVIVDHYTDERQTVEGTEDDVRSQLLTLYPYLLKTFGPHCSIDILVNAMNKFQGTTACVVNSMQKNSTYTGDVVDGSGLHIVRYDQDTKHGQIHSVDEQLARCRAAAEFLAGSPCQDKEMRQALLQSDGDPELAALLAHGLTVDKLPDLRGIVAASSLTKSEEEHPIVFKDVMPTTASSKEFANAVKRSSDNKEIESVWLGAGKHAKGMLMARDEETHRSYILKPGSGKQNPVVGETESGSTQSQREAAFYSVALAWGLGEYLPECHLLLIDDNEYACMSMLPMVYKNFNDLKANDPDLPRRLLLLYNDGTLHKWATLDFVCGNPDRHSGNLMASGDKVKLIDHGSTFAGYIFNPAKDGVSFVPYYLRPGISKFTTLTVDEKLRKMPRLNPTNEALYKKWLLGLSFSVLSQCLIQYGIESIPSQNRLERLQKATAYQTADLAILSAWVVD